MPILKSMKTTHQGNLVSLADLITLLYDEYLLLYKNEELASVAAATTINDILADRAEEAVTDVS